MIGLLAASSIISGDLVARISSTPHVQGIVQVSLAPVFLLASIAALLNVMNGRLIWIADRVDRLERRHEDGAVELEYEELPALRLRQRYAHTAINLSTAAALVICTVIAMMFVSAFVRPPLGTYVAAAWIAAMALVVGSLLFFLLETRLATRSARDRRLLSEQLRRRKSDDKAGEG